MKKTILYNFHKEQNAKLINFFEWEMPLYYTSIKEESLAVRNSCGIFDVSHMGNFFIEGGGAENFIENVITNSITPKKNCQVLYSLICNQKGGIIDDILVYKFSEKKFLLIVNASNREKDFNWLSNILNIQKFDVSLNDVTDNYSLIAVQGPESERIISEKLNLNLKNLSYYNFIEIDENLIISRTGYTGSKGYEIFVKNELAEEIWNKLIKECQPCGLGARDVLRIEAGMPLYGNELSEDINPFQAGLEKFVDFNKYFIGKDELLELKDKTEFKRIGFEMECSRIARHNCEIFDENNRKIGWVSSGTFSFFLNKSIGMGFILKNFSGKKIKIKLQNEFYYAKIKELPFIKLKTKE